jgi:Bacterial Ig-like domain (group 2)
MLVNPIHRSLKILAVLSLALALLLSACGGGGGGGSGSNAGASNPGGGPSVTAIAITPPNSTTPLGVSAQLTATATYSNGTTGNVTAQASWSSSNPQVASVGTSGGTNGLVVPVSAGATVITASLGGVSGTSSFTVAAASVTAIAITPANSSTPLGVSEQLTATATYSDHTAGNVTAQAGWSSSNPQVATVNTGGATNGLVTPSSQGATVITATFAGISGITNVTVTAAALKSITVTPPSPSIVLGAKEQFAASGTYTDNTNQNITNSVTWSSSNTAVATIANSGTGDGLATSVATGTATITATLGAITASTSLTVAPAQLSSLTVSPSSSSIELINTNQQFTATGTYSDGSTKDVTAQVTWTTGDPGVIQVSNDIRTPGLGTPISVGSTTVSATSGSVVGTASLSVATSGLSSWTAHAFQGGTGSPMAYSGSRYVLTTDRVTSTDGKSWHPLNGVAPGCLNQGPILWTGSQFVSVTTSGNFAATSPDGLKWACNKYSPQLGAGSYGIVGLAWSGSQLVATIQGGTDAAGNKVPGGFLTSPDSVTWTARPSVNSDSMTAIAWTGSKFYALGAQSVQTSADGASWTALATTGPSGATTALAWSGSRFVAVGLGAASNFPGPPIQTSTDGITWTAASSSTALGSYAFQSVTWSGSEFVAVGYPWNSTVGVGGTSYGVIATSPDGLTWVLQTQSLHGEALRSVLWSGSGFIVGGDLGLQTSPDAVTWTYTPSFLAIDPGGYFPALTGVVRSGSKFVAVGGQGVVFDSPDGVSWTPRASNVGAGVTLTGIAWSGTLYAVGMSNGGILTSPDGISWTVQTTGTTSKVDSIVWSGSQFVAVGGNGLILTSPNGVTWTPRVSGTTEELGTVALSGGHYVAAASDGLVALTSSDGITWTVSKTSLQLLAASSTQFVARASAYSVLLTSPDGVTWTRHPAPVGVAQLMSSGSAFWLGGCSQSGTVACGLFTSTDGVTWSLSVDLGGAAEVVGVSSVATSGSTSVAVRMQSFDGTNLLSLP